MGGSPDAALDAAVQATVWNFACPDWVDRLLAGKTLFPDLPLDAARADQAVKIFDKLRVPDIKGQPLLAIAGGNWFREIVRVVFGSLDDEGIRHVPEIFALVGKKNSKTTYSAALMLTALLVNDVPNGEFLFIGPTQEIADTAFSQAVGMIKADDEGFLQKRFRIQDHKKTITDRVSGAFIKVKTFSMDVMTGTKPIGVLIDELHVLGTVNGAASVLIQIRGALESKPNSFLLIISTQSVKPPAGVFKSELQYARSVRDGKVPSGRMLPVLYEFPEAMQTDKAKPWADPKFWHAVMPNLGRSLHLDIMSAGYQTAKDKGDEAERLWASQHLNVQIGLALHSERWRGADYWEAAGDEKLTLDSIIERCEVLTVGIDGGGLDDLFGLAVIGREKETKRWLSWCCAWAHDDVLKRRKDIVESLTDFEKAGELILCKHPTQDIEEAADIVERIFLAGKLPEKFGVGLDPVGVSALVDELEDREVKTAENGGPVCAVFQGYKLSGAVWGMERKLKNGTLRHVVQALMAWCVGNAKAEQRGNAVLITKEVSGKAKIDPLCALFNAFTLMSRGPEPAQKDLSGMISNPVMVI